MPEALPDSLSHYELANAYKRAILNSDAELLEQLLLRPDAPQMMRAEIHGDSSASGWHMPLMMALASSFPTPHSVDLAQVRMLLDAGTAINAIVDYRGNRPSPLFAAIIGGSLDAVNLLIERGADIHYAHPDPPWFEGEARTMLRVAIEGPIRYGFPRTLEAERTQIALRLLELGANPHGATGVPRPLQIAARNNNLAVAHALLERGADVNAQGSDAEQSPDHHLYQLSSTALMEAARGEESSVLPLLLERGANVHARGDNGTTALTNAVAYGAPTCARLLLEAGAEPHIMGEYNMSLIGSALNAGHFFNDGDPLQDEELRSRRVYEMVKLLLEYGADANGEAMGNISVLAHAVARGELELVRLLLSAGADVSSATEGRSTPLLESLARNNSAQASVIAVLLAEHGLETNKNELNRSLKEAARQGNLPLVRLLVQMGTEIDSRDKTGSTPLHSAASWGHSDVVELLLSHGADANALGEGMTPLMRIAWGGHSSMLRESRAVYGDKSDPDAWVAERDLATVQALLHAGADVLVQSNQATALDYAARNSSPEIVQVLIAAHSQVNARLKFNRTPLHSVLRSGRRQSLLKKEPHLQVWQPVYAATAHQQNEGIVRLNKAVAQDEAVVQVLLQAGADINALDGARHTPLHHAALFATPRAVQMLLDAGADVKVANLEGMTPLQQVLAEGRCVTLLAKHNIRLSDIEGMPGDLLASARGEMESSSLFQSAKPEVVAALEEDVAMLNLLLKAGDSQAF